MSKEVKYTDISEIRTIPELIRLAEQVRDTKQPTVLSRGDEDLVELRPPRPVRKRIKGRPITKDDPLSKLIGIGHSEGPGDVSENKHKYLAEDYLKHHMTL